MYGNPSLINVYFPMYSINALVRSISLLFLISFDYLLHSLTRNEPGLLIKVLSIAGLSFVYSIIILIMVFSIVSIISVIIALASFAILLTILFLLLILLINLLQSL